jgi:hypothetical protein
MKTKLVVASSYLICFVGLAFTAWISLINLDEIVSRAKGEYTFYSQRATLTDDEAVIYFTCWTILFLFTSYLTTKRLINKRYVEAIICAVFLLLFILLSTYVDKFFYNQLV